MNTQWINSQGGPLIFCDIQAAAGWRGIIGSSAVSVETDYERACNSFSYLDVVNSNQSQVLVLGDEPMQSTIVNTRHGIVIARWISCKLEVDVDGVLGYIPVDLPEIETSVFLCINDPISVLFDSARLFQESSEEMLVPIEPGNYKITTEIFKVKDSFEFLIHRLNLAKKINAA